MIETECTAAKWFLLFVLRKCPEVYILGSWQPPQNKIIHKPRVRDVKMQKYVRNVVVSPLLLFLLHESGQKRHFGACKVMPWAPFILTKCPHGYNSLRGYLSKNIFTLHASLSYVPLSFLVFSL